MKKVPQSFIYPEIKETDYTFGSKQITGAVLNLDRDWRPFTTPEEAQRRNGVESSACFIEAQQATIASILEKKFNVLDGNFSARFNLFFSQASSLGGDPLKGAQTFRDRGLIPDEMLPFSSDIKSWGEFNSFKGANRELCEKTGQQWRGEWEPQYDIVVTRDMTVKDAYSKMREALMYSPVPMSVAQGYDGGQPKPKGARDVHMVQLLYIDETGRPTIKDTYPPFIKTLAPYYHPEFAIRWNVERNTTAQQISLLTRIIALLRQMVGLVEKTQPEAPQPLPEPSKYDWDTPVLARNSVRVICDEEGLTVTQKNELCATVGGESGWKINAKLENKKNGKVWSTDWGICQINDHYHIGPGKSFATLEDALNPEKAVRWMCKQWKAGNKNWWVAYKSGAYKRYL